MNRNNKTAQYIKTITTLIVFTIGTLSALAQDSLFIWKDGVPNSKENNLEETFMWSDVPRIKNVTNPTLNIYLPPKEKANGTAVIICPGGGYAILAVKHEGYDLAEWFNSMGIAAFVLKYRLPNDESMVDKKIGPLQDAQQAIRLVRENAAQWNVNPEKIGIMGFSAGGHLASTAGTHFEKPVTPANSTSVRPDFNLLIYPVISFKESFTHMGSRNNLIGKNASYDLVEEYSNEMHITENTPPTFLVHSSDDNAVPVENSIRFYQELVKNKVPAEMHIFETGGHGYGMGRNELTKAWPERLKTWLHHHKLID
ncbi:alpha/beta hydrolase [Chondrinema litorale]|uniref:alpha/beta hydrolase n=1 Tax=Chondrinema litorale TaxID=2994555 RepID=UPI002542F27C|nr:alpha/beta hydrolase [Chondrinema litorale]UZR94810.1 alpha/beta hydrolase [Chondrinema litorale]